MDALTSLTAGQVAGWAACILAVLSVFIEIVPIKINPITSLLSWIGKRINKDLSVKVDGLSSKVDGLEEEIRSIKADAAEHNAIQCRVRILQFGDEVRQGKPHSKENYDQVLSDIDDYDRYCREHPNFKNNRTLLTEQKILDTYQECVDNNSFL